MTELSESICVVGLGKIGLPLAVRFAQLGARVVGADLDPAVVEAVSQAQSPVAREPHLAEGLAEAVTAGRLRATTDVTAAAADSSTIMIIVPVAIDDENQADYRFMDLAIREVGRGLRPGALVVIESTLPVGTTRRHVGRLLEEESGLAMGIGFSLAYSPERVYSGRIFQDLEAYPKVVGGVDPQSIQRAADLYRHRLRVPVVTVDDAETAEFVKLVETTYRDVNIALANELARYAAARGLDALSAIEVANTQPFSHIHAPGVGVGGHCIPVYPYFLLQDAAAGELTLVRAARRINDDMASYAVELLQQSLGSLKGQRILVLGVAYRGNVKEAAFSSAFLLARALQHRAATVLVHDPLFASHEIASMGLVPFDFDSSPPIDAVVLQAYHDEYRELDWRRFNGCRVVLDGRGVLRREAVEGVGMRFLQVGAAFSGRHSLAASGEPLRLPPQVGNGHGCQERQ